MMLHCCPQSEKCCLQKCARYLADRLKLVGARYLADRNARNITTCSLVSQRQLLMKKI